MRSLQVPAGFAPVHREIDAAQELFVGILALLRRKEIEPESHNSYQHRGDRIGIMADERLVPFLCEFEASIHQRLGDPRPWEGQGCAFGFWVSWVIPASKRAWEMPLRASAAASISDLRLPNLRCGRPSAWPHPCPGLD